MSRVLYLIRHGRSDLDSAEMARRRQTWKPPAPRYTAGVLHKYARQVSSASLGAVTDL